MRNELTQFKLPPGLSQFASLEMGDNPLREVLFPEGSNLNSLRMTGYAKDAAEFYRPPLRIRTIEQAHSDLLQFTITGPISRFRVESTRDFSKWISVGEGIIESSTYPTTISLPLSETHAFFRVVDIAD